MSNDDDVGCPGLAWLPGTTDARAWPEGLSWTKSFHSSFCRFDARAPTGGAAQPTSRSIALPCFMMSAIAPDRPALK
jgi:hypothetical protein